MRENLRQASRRRTVVSESRSNVIVNISERPGWFHRSGTGFACRKVKVEVKQNEVEVEDEVGIEFATPLRSDKIAKLADGVKLEVGINSAASLRSDRAAVVEHDITAYGDLVLGIGIFEVSLK